jgi:hypothetical protein
MAKQAGNNVKLESPKKKRRGVHAKSKSSKIKGSKNYKKRNVAQGR